MARFYLRSYFHFLYIIFDGIFFFFFFENCFGATHLEEMGWLLLFCFGRGNVHRTIQEKQLL